MRSILFLCSASLIGCTAQMINPAGSSGSSYAPLNDRDRPGLVKYLTDGAGFIVSQRRESAYKQMFESCGGPYRIIAEGQRVEGGVVVSSTTAAGSATARTSGATASVEASGTGATVRESGRTTDVAATATSQTTTASSEFHYWYISYKCAAKSDTARTSPPPSSHDARLPTASTAGSVMPGRL